MSDYFILLCSLQAVFVTIHIPTYSKRRMLASALHQAILINIIADTEIHIEDEGYDSEVEDSEDEDMAI